MKRTLCSTSTLLYPNCSNSKLKRKVNDYIKTDSSFIESTFVVDFPEVAPSLNENIANLPDSLIENIQAIIDSYVFRNTDAEESYLSNLGLLFQMSFPHLFKKIAGLIAPIFSKLISEVVHHGVNPDFFNVT